MKWVTGKTGPSGKKELLGLGGTTKDFCEFDMLSVTVAIVGFAMMEIKSLKNGANIGVHVWNK